jgi:hypothetical protein
MPVDVTRRGFDRRAAPLGRKPADKIEHRAGDMLARVKHDLGFCRLEKIRNIDNAQGAIAFALIGLAGPA